MIAAGHEAKSLRIRVGDGDGSPQACPLRILAETTEVTPMKQSLVRSQAEKISDDALAELVMMMAMLSPQLATTMESVTVTMHSFKAKMKGDVENLAAKMVTGFSSEGVEREKIGDGLEEKTASGL